MPAKVFIILHRLISSQLPMRSIITIRHIYIYIYIYIYFPVMIETLMNANMLTNYEYLVLLLIAIEASLQ
jgi:hypothetical protein